MPKFHAPTPIVGDLVYMMFNDECLLGEGKIESIEPGYPVYVTIDGIGACTKLHWPAEDLTLFTSELPCGSGFIEKYRMPRLKGRSGPRTGTALSDRDWSGGYWIIKVTRSN